MVKSQIANNSEFTNDEVSAAPENILWHCLIIEKQFSVQFALGECMTFLEFKVHCKYLTQLEISSFDISSGSDWQV